VQAIFHLEDTLTAETPTYEKLQEKAKKLEHEASTRSNIEERYRVQVEHSLQALIIIQSAYIVFANSSFTEMSGYTRDELFPFLPMR
jgi:PAS domain-containing protein